MSINPAPENNNNPIDEKKKAWVNFNGDILGIGKFLGHLGLGKLPVFMRYCLATNLLVTMVLGLMLFSGIKIENFPTANDFRMCIVLFFIVFFCGIILFWREKSS